MWARWGLDPVAGARDGIEIEWADGRFTRVHPTGRPPRDLPPELRFGDHLLTPGLLNAHTHLDYSLLRGRLPRGRGFGPWLWAMIELRRAPGGLGPDSARPAITRAVDELIEDGVTEVWDVSSYGWASETLRAGGLAATEFIEWLAPTAERADAWESWVASNEGFFSIDEAGSDEGGSIRRGLSPHSPYTVCQAGLEQAASWAAKTNRPLAIHLAEFPEERELLREGRGELQAIHEQLIRLDLASALGVGPSSIERAASAGLLGPATLAIHCNLPEPGEAQLLAESGAPIVFCPLSHRFFGYPPYPLEAYRRAGARLTLGTDSLASNDRLSIRAEARALAQQATGWTPTQILACATGAGLGETAPFGGRGRLAPGRPAQWALWRLNQTPPPSREGPTAESLMMDWLRDETPCERSSARPNG